MGDLHGQHRMLQTALSHVSFNTQRDRLIGLGDLVDRGLGSEKLLRLLEREPWFVSVIGNHDALLWARFQSTGHRTPYVSGTEWHLRLKRENLFQLSRVVEGMPMAMELPLPDGRTLGLVHAEVPPGSSWDHVRNVDRLRLEFDVLDEYGRMLGSSLLWGRRRLYGEDDDCPPIDGIDDVFAGHNIVSDWRPQRKRQCVFLESGAFRSQGRLTLVEPLKGIYWQVHNGSGSPWVIGGAPTPMPLG